ncbi:hypothetical protein DFQ10_104136 [Winogradskyella eximia]|uniref:Lipoprotein n=1 Tax=Winogradskyella eximia TaxID=262006 RepID=A0A3D9H358_9FLAO|nr:hypothetical protein [Winogradskyella eximia]RED43945.1 hypothetical protein DFQ10_104136 [Winogradskyella eximia]
MNKYIFTLLLTILLVSCKQKNDEKQNIENLTQGPIVHKSLSQDQLTQIKYIQKTFNEVLPVSLEETITNFKRDQNPDNEIRIWLNMAKAYEAFSLKNPEEEKVNLRKEAFMLVFMRSMMSEEEIMKNEKTEYKLLTEKDIKEIFKNYTLVPKPITINK